jgi:hypothetical protein
MSILAKAAALLDAANPAELDAMTPAERQRFADLMWHWQRIAERRQQNQLPAPKSGVRAQLAAGERAP